MTTGFNKALLGLLFSIAFVTCFYISSITSATGTSNSAASALHSASTSINTTQHGHGHGHGHEDGIGEKQEQEQRIVLLAGPHKTGTSSLQYNFVRWTKQIRKGSKSNANANATSTTTIWDDWVWPIPDEVVKIYSPHAHATNSSSTSTLTSTSTSTSTSTWSPNEVDKAYYPLMEALRSPERKIPDREIFQLYKPDEIIQMFAKSILESWELGYNLVFGSEAMDLIVKLPEGQEMLKTISDRILPITVPVAAHEEDERGEHNSDHRTGSDGDGGTGTSTSTSSGSQITVVVTYRTPKIDHLVSNWHQICKGKDVQPFFEYITTTKNKLGVLDALGLVEMFLKYTNWNVALVDYEFVEKSQWDLTSYIACHFLRVECNLDTKEIVGLAAGKENPIVKNERKNQSAPNLSDEALAEMDTIMMAHDCNYKNLFEEGNEWKKGGRLILHHKLGIDRMMENCKTFGHDYPSQAEMKEKLVQVAKKHGPKKFGF